MGRLSRLWARERVRTRGRHHTHIRVILIHLWCGSDGVHGSWWRISIHRGHCTIWNDTIGLLGWPLSVVSVVDTAYNRFACWRRHWARLGCRRGDFLVRSLERLALGRERLLGLNRRFSYHTERDGMDLDTII